MLKARQAKELVVTVANRIGVLAELSRLISQKGINILAVSARAEGQSGVVHLLTDDTLRAADALREKNYNPKQTDVVVAELPHKPGMLRHLTERLAADGIDIEYLYASATADQDKSLVVLNCKNNSRAVVLLNEKQPATTG
jgi:hypothetical protein